MRSVVCLLLLVCSLSVVSAQTFATLGATQTLTTTATTYAYGGTALTPLPPYLTISSNAAATFTFELVANLGVSVGAGVTGVPDGFASVGLTGQLGYRLTLSAQADITATLSTPAITALATVAAAGQVGVLQYDVNAQAYTRIPANRVTVSSLGAVNISLPGQGTFYIVTVNTAPISKAIENSIVVATNTAVNFTVTEGTRTALALNNILAAAGALFVRASTNAVNQTAAIVAQGRVAVSTIYNFTHSAGAGAVTSVELRYDTAQSATAAASFDLASAAWYKFDTVTNAWVRQQSTVQGTVVVFVTTGFSEWSVQANPPTSSSSTAAGGGNPAGSSSARNAAQTVSFSAATLFLVAAFSLVCSRFF
jgi:hypothetical protein